MHVVGRTRERAVLAEALCQAEAGAGGVVLVAGEGGIGKTTLAADLSATAGHRCVQVVYGHGWEGQGAPPLVVWDEVLRALGHDEPVLRPSAAVATRARREAAAGQQVRSRRPTETLVLPAGETSGGIARSSP